MPLALAEKKGLVSEAESEWAWRASQLRLSPASGDVTTARLRWPLVTEKPKAPGAPIEMPAPVIVRSSVERIAPATSGGPRIGGLPGDDARSERAVAVRVEVDRSAGVKVKATEPATKSRIRTFAAPLACRNAPERSIVVAADHELVAA